MTGPSAGSWPDQVMDVDDVRGALRRMASGIIERDKKISLDEVIVIGLQTGAPPMAEALVSPSRRSSRASAPSTSAPSTWPSTRTVTASARSCRGGRRHAPVDLAGDGVVILVDDVLFTGHTVRAALDAITDRRDRCDLPARR